MSVHERVKSYSGNLALATQHDRVGIYSSIQTQTTPFQWRDIASKCPGSETRDRLSAREKSSRASPTKRAGERFLQPLLCGSQKGWGTPPNSRSQTYQQSALQTSVPDDNAETFSKCMDAALSPLRVSVDPQLSGRLADFSSVPGHATQPHRLAAYSHGVPRAMCKHAKEHSSPESVHNISGSMLRLRGDESPPLAGTRGGHFVFPAQLQRRQLCSF